jgi:hypothetical protein
LSVSLGEESGFQAVLEPLTIIGSLRKWCLRLQE